MARPKIVERDYYLFRQALRDAVDSGKRIDKTQKQAWKDWVKSHRIKEAAFKSFGKGMYEGLEPVIIDSDGDWGGYFLYSEIEEACLTWVRDPDESAD